MKYLSPVTTSVLLGLGLLVGATPAVADPTVQTTIPQNQTATLGDLVGSDTLEDISKAVLAIAPAITTDDGSLAGRGISNYLGLGSSAGQRQLIGNPSAGEPTCTAQGGSVGGDANWGCQEVAPMSRQMNSAVCSSDADDPRDPDDSTSANSTAEGLAVCLDGISIITDNASHRQFADSAAQCVTPSGEPVWGPVSDNSAGIPGTNGYGTTGRLRNSGTIGSYTIGANGVPGWKDVLRLIYTGCTNADGTCAATITRATRCGATTNPVRANLVNNYGNIFEGVDCAEGNHCTQLRAAYRRDDASGTTGFFLEVLGLRAGTSDLASRTRISNLGGSGTTGFQNPPENIFCDGGQHEGLWPAPYTGSTPVVAAVIAGQAVIGDPLQRTCALEDDICGPSGTIGLVRAIRSPREFGYPTVQCTRGSFDRKAWPNTGSVPSCADGTAPTLRGCYAPFYNAGGGVQNFDCLNPSNSRPLQSPATLDGRVFNFIWRLSNGDLSDINHQQANTALLPEVASWRQNMATMNTGIGASAGGPFGAAPVGSSQTYAAQGPQAQFTKTFTGGVVCQQASATSVIGCVVGNTRCTIGFAGREAADRPPSDDTQEAIRLPGANGNPSVPSDSDIITDNYPISRSLFINAIGGFENIAADCAARGGSAEYCADQLEFTRRFYNMTAGSAVAAACTDNGFIPIVDPVAACGSDPVCNAMQTKWDTRCVGSQGAASCGRVTAQPADRCNPDATVSPETSSTNLCTDYSPNSGAGPICG